MICPPISFPSSASLFLSCVPLSLQFLNYKSLVLSFIYFTSVYSVYGKQNNGFLPFPQRCPCPNFWNLWICYIIFKGGIMVANKLTLRLKMYPRLYGRAQCNHQHPLSMKMEMEESGSEWCSLRKTQQEISGFEDDRDSGAKECRQPPEPGKGKKIDLLHYPAGRQPYWNLEF